MQRTRLNTLVEVNGSRLTQFFSNPWRRISLTIMGFLFGFFIGAAISTTAGQDAQWDVVGAGLILLFVEFISRLVYRQPRLNTLNSSSPNVPSNSQSNSQRSLWLEILNFFKMGMVYSLFLEAFKLGS